MLKLSWQVKGFEWRGYGYDLVSQAALSINMAANKIIKDTTNPSSLQGIEDLDRIKYVSWKLHVRITEANYVDLPTVDVKGFYSKLREKLHKFITKE